MKKSFDHSNIANAHGCLLALRVWTDVFCGAMHDLTYTTQYSHIATRLIVPICAIGNLVLSLALRVGSVVESLTLPFLGDVVICIFNRSWTPLTKPFVSRLHRIVENCYLCVTRSGYDIMFWGYIAVLGTIDPRDIFRVSKKQLDTMFG